MKNEPRKWLSGPLALWLAVGLCYFGALIMASTFFPRHYDWERTVISSLGSPRDNPQGHWIAVAGLVISGLLLVPFEALLEKRLGSRAPKWTKAAGRLFLIAAICLLLSAIVAPGHYRILGLSRTHEHLAQISGVAFCLSLFFYLIAVLRVAGTQRWIRLASLLLVLLPLLMLLASRLALVAAYEFHATTAYQDIRASLWCSLALWEWIGSVCIYLFLGTIALGLPENATLDQRRA